jgi:hypothetical protein
MASGLFASAINSIMTNTLDMDDADIRIGFVDSDVAALVDLDTQEFIGDLELLYEDEPLFLRTALTNAAANQGQFDADDVVITGGGNVGDVAAGIIFFKHTGDNATAQMVAFIDNATGLPYTIAESFTIVWDEGANAIFRIVSPS